MAEALLECAICFDTVSVCRTFGCCALVCCDSCLQGWINTSRNTRACPGCRQPMNERQTIFYSNKRKIEKCALKLRIVDEIVNSDTICTACNMFIPLVSMKAHYEAKHYTGVPPTSGIRMPSADKGKGFPVSEVVGVDRNLPEAVTGVVVPYTDDAMISIGAMGESRTPLAHHPLILKTSHIVKNHIFENETDALEYVERNNLLKSDYVCTTYVQVRVPRNSNSEITNKYDVTYKYANLTSFETCTELPPLLSARLSCRIRYHATPFSENTLGSESEGTDITEYSHSDYQSDIESVIAEGSDDGDDDDDRTEINSDEEREIIEETDMETDEEIDLGETDDETDDDEWDDGSDIDEEGNIEGLIDYDCEQTEEDRQAIISFFGKPL